MADGAANYLKLVTQVAYVSLRCLEILYQLLMLLGLGRKSPVWGWIPVHRTLFSATRRHTSPMDEMQQIYVQAH